MYVEKCNPLLNNCKKAKRYGYDVPTERKNKRITGDEKNKRITGDDNTEHTIDNPHNDILAQAGLGHYQLNTNHHQEDHNDNFMSASGGKSFKHQMISRAGKEFEATHHTVSKETRRSAIFSDATYKMNKGGIDEAQKFINDKLGTDRYIIDPKHSDKLILTIVDTKDSKAILAYRGSVNKSDWALNGMNWLSNDLKELHPEMKKIDSHFKEVSSQYDIKHVTGHSKGGLLGIRQASKHNIPADVFNAEIFGTNHSYLDNINEKGTDVKIHRITHDTASYGLASYNIKKGLEKGGHIGSFAGDVIKSGGSLRQPLLNAVGNIGNSSKYTPNNLDIRTYHPLNGYENPLHAHSLENFHNTEISRSPSTRTTRQHISHTGTQLGGQIGINLLSNELTNNFVDTIIGNENIDPTLNTALQGGVSNMITEKAAQGLGLHTTIGGSKISMRNAGISGVVSSVVGAEVQNEAYNALINAGLDHNSSTLISSTSGGAATGGTEYAANVAIQFAEKKFGKAVISSAIKNQIARGVARMGVGEAISILGGGVARGAVRGSKGSLYGTAIGAGVGLLMGVWEILSDQSQQEKEVNALPPSYNSRYDLVIGTDAKVKEIMKKLNDGELSPEETKRQILARIDEIPEIPSDYYNDFEFVDKVPEHLINYEQNLGGYKYINSENKGVLLSGEYRGEKEYKAQQQAKQKAFNNDSEKQALIELISLQGTPDWDDKKQQHLDAYLEQLHNGTLRQDLVDVFANNNDDTTDTTDNPVNNIVTNLENNVSVRPDEGRQITNRARDGFPLENIGNKIGNELGDIWNRLTGNP